VELGIETFSRRDREDGVKIKETGTEASGVFTCGVLDNIDVVAGFPNAWDKAKENGAGLCPCGTELRYHRPHYARCRFQIRPEQARGGLCYHGRHNIELLNLRTCVQAYPDSGNAVEKAIRILLNTVKKRCTIYQTFQGRSGDRQKNPDLPWTYCFFPFLPT